MIRYEPPPARPGPREFPGVQRPDSDTVVT
jgi:hypothetical protein